MKTDPTYLKLSNDFKESPNASIALDLAKYLVGKSDNEAERFFKEYYYVVFLLKTNAFLFNNVVLNWIEHWRVIQRIRKLWQRTRFSSKLFARIMIAPKNSIKR